MGIIFLLFVFYPNMGGKCYSWHMNVVHRLNKKESHEPRCRGILLRSR